MVGKFSIVLQGSETFTTNYLIKQLPIATVFLNADFEVVHASDKWILDFELSDREVMGKSIHQLIDSVSDEWQEVLEACLLGKGGDTGLEPYKNMDGQEGWFEWTNIPWFDAEEHVIGIIIQTADVTERIKKESQHEKLQLILREKSEIAKIGSWEYDAETDELQWSEMTRQIHEVPEYFTPDINTAIEFYKEGFSRNTISLALFKSMESKTSWCEKLEIITAEGNEKWVIAAGKPLIKDGEYKGLIGTFQDITHMVQSEIKTRESEDLLRTVLDNIPINIYIKDMDSRKILVNKAECQYLGVTDPNELLGKNDFDIYDKEIAQISREEDLIVMNSQTPSIGRETINVTKDGVATSFLTSKIPFIGEDGECRGIIGISLDITNLKQHEAELRNLINVTSLQNKKLVNFAHIVSHNLRSHTANFSMLLDFLVKEQDEKEKQNIIGMLTTASDNLMETLVNLNEVVAINSNTNLSKKRVDLREKVGIVTHNLAEFLKEGKATIINRIPKRTLVNVLPAYIESIILNLITNSVRYKNPDRDPVIQLSAIQEGKYTVLSIADNGLGIDLKKNKDKLFGMYKTFHGNSDARGIGLYITKNQIEAMKGKIEVSSELGSGTTFKVFFNEKD